jgi:hypothetical protein
VSYQGPLAVGDDVLLMMGDTNFVCGSRDLRRVSFEHHGKAVENVAPALRHVAAQ